MLFRHYAAVLGLSLSLMACQGGDFGSESAVQALTGKSSKEDGDAKKSEDKEPASHDQKKEGQSIDVQWPPNHRMEALTIDKLTDEADLSQCKIVAITSNEIEKSTEEDDLDDDFNILGDLRFEVRVERLGSGEGRIYKVEVVCGKGDDARTHIVEVRVPHDWQDKGAVEPASAEGKEKAKKS